MTDDELRRLAEAATPGPWRLEYDEQYRLAYRYLIGPAMSLSWPTYATDLSREQTGQREVDGAYIAAANPETVKRLLDRVAKAEADALAARAEGRIAGMEEAARIADQKVEDTMGSEGEEGAGMHLCALYLADEIRAAAKESEA